MIIQSEYDIVQVGSWTKEKSVLVFVPDRSMDQLVLTVFSISLEIDFFYMLPSHNSYIIFKMQQIQTSSFTGPGSVYGLRIHYLRRPPPINHVFYL